MQAQQADIQPPVTDIYLVLAGDEVVQAGIALAEQLRAALPRLRLLMNTGGGNLKSQMKRADKSH